MVKRPDPHVVTYWPDAKDRERKIVLRVPASVEPYKLLTHIQRKLLERSSGAEKTRGNDEIPF